MGEIATWCATFIGALFVYSSAQKLIDMKGWIAQSAELGVPRSVATAVAPLEGLVGIATIVDTSSRLALVATLILLVGFTVLLISLLVRGRRPPCACFGARRRRAISWLTVLRNLVFVGINVVALLGMGS